MRKTILILALALSLNIPLVLADVIPMGQKYIPGCAIIKNASEFAEVKFIAAVYDSAFYEPKPAKPSKIMAVENDTCLHTAGKGEPVTLFAVEAKAYELIVKNPDYNPEGDMNAYPIASAYGSESFQTYDALVDISSKDTYFHREYMVQGFDNSKRVIVLTHTADVTDHRTTDYTPKAITASLENSLKLDTPIFKDLPLNAFSAKAVLDLKRKNMIEGYSDGTFKPKNLINRAEFVKIIMSDYPRDYDCSKQIFKDVSPLEMNWYRNYVCWAYGEYAIHGDERVISGYADGTFRPQQNINFAEAAKIIVNAEKVSSEQKTEPWYRQYINIFEKIKAVPSSIKSPDQKITREEMALLMYSITEHRGQL